MSGSLPSSFQYFASKIAGVSRKSIRVQPVNSTTVKNNQSITFDMPSDAIIDLTSCVFRGDFKYTNAVGSTNGLRFVPQPHSLVRAEQWSLNGQVVNGQSCNHKGQIYEAVRRASMGKSGDASHHDEYMRVPTPWLLGDQAGGDAVSRLYGDDNEDVASNTQSRRIHYKAFWGLAQTPNSESWDTAICGQTRVRLELAGTEVCMSQADSGTTDYDWQIDNCELVLDVISFADNTYDMLMSQLLSNPESELLIPCTNYVSQIDTASASLKFNVSTNSLDCLCFAGLNANYASPTEYTTTTGVLPANTLAYGANNSKFTLYKSDGSLYSAADALSDASTNQSFYYMVNGITMPQYGAVNVQDSLEFTKQVYSHGKDDRNILFAGWKPADSLKDDGSAQTERGLVLDRDAGIFFRRCNALDNNYIVCMKTALTAPAAQSRVASGISTLGTSSQVSLNLQNFDNGDQPILQWAVCSSILSVRGGQQVAVQY